MEERRSPAQLTIAAAADASNRLANAFLGLGLRPGDRVAYVAQNHLEYVVLEFALLKAGLVKVPLNHRFAPQELRRCMDLADVRPGRGRRRLGRGRSTGCSRTTRPLSVVIGARTGGSPSTTWSPAAHRRPVQVPVGPDDLYHIRFSSGSTGRPRASRSPIAVRGRRSSATPG